MASTEKEKGEKQVQPGGEVPAKEYQKFREVVASVHGNCQGNIGTALEAAIDLYIRKHTVGDETQGEVSNADLLATLKELKDVLSNERKHAHTQQRVNGQGKTEQRYERIVAHLSDRRRPTQKEIETAVRREGFVDTRTVDKYREMMEARGDILPAPEGLLRDGEETKTYVRGLTKFAISCESNDEITAKHVDQWVGRLINEGIISSGDYADSLPDDYGTDDQQLKIEQSRENK